MDNQSPVDIADPVLVTGAFGFIGKALISRLSAAGKNIIAFDIIKERKPRTWGKNVRIIQGDITQLDHVDAAIAKAKTIFHLAAVVGDWGTEELHENVTVGGTRNLFESALISPLKPQIILASSVVVYGDQINQGPCHEGLPLGKCFGPYSRSKQEQEKLAQLYFQKGLKVTIVRPANVYGAGSKPWVDDLSTELRRGSPVLIGGGNHNAGLVHVDNVVEVMIRAAEHPNSFGQIYNAADEEPITWREYCTELSRMNDLGVPRSIPKFMAGVLATAGEQAFRVLNMSQRPPITHEALNLVGSTNQYDMTKTKNDLGYKPVKTYAQGLEEIQDYLKSQTV